MSIAADIEIPDAANTFDALWKTILNAWVEDPATADRLLLLDELHSLAVA